MRLSLRHLAWLSVWLLYGGCSDGSLFPIGSPVNSTKPDGSSDRTTETPTDTQSTDLQTTSTDTDETASQDDNPDTHFSVGAQAEDYDTMDAKAGRRAWYVITADSTPALVDPDDNSHAATAHGGTYLEVLPDLRVVENDPNDDGYGMMGDPDLSAEVGFRVYLAVAGRYYMWVRGFSTGTQDNSLFVGRDGQWPASGKNLQFPAHSNAWVWSSNQRDSGGNVYGEPLTIYLDVDSPGEHLVTFAMREDGFEIDEWFMTTDPNWVP